MTSIKTTVALFRILRGESVIMDCPNENIAKTTFNELKEAEKWLIPKKQMSEMKLNMSEKT